MKFEQTLFIVGVQNYDGLHFKVSTYNESVYDPAKFLVESFEFEYDVQGTTEDLIVKHLDSIAEFRKTVREEYQHTVKNCDEIERKLRQLTYQTESDYISKDDEMP